MLLSFVKCLPTDGVLSTWNFPLGTLSGADDEIGHPTHQRHPAQRMQTAVVLHRLLDQLHHVENDASGRAGSEAPDPAAHGVDHERGDQGREQHVPDHVDQHLDLLPPSAHVAAFENRAQSGRWPQVSVLFIILLPNTFYLFKVHID